MKGEEEASTALGKDSAGDEDRHRRREVREEPGKVTGNCMKTPKSAQESLGETI